ncbi:MAG TPA: ribonuclease J [Anaerolineaceae bacterium]|nr:ribonuclease J [Anaerolineaceae bacterium]HPN52199.1 ribonuclease J [Anaerolineaceae bacterium]
MKKKLKIIPLGGFGEVGKNMLAYEYNHQILVVDAGLMFPENEMTGVDYIIPDFEYLKKKSDKVVGIVITHGHEDHIGAIQHLLKAVPAPVYGTALTLGLVEVKLNRAGMAGKADLRTVKAGEALQIGPFKVEFFHVCHSIPDSVGLGITCPAGLVVHTGDYKFDQTPVDNWQTDFAKLTEFSSRGVDILLADSTNAETPGWTPSERIIGPAFDAVIRDAPGRVIIATFASLISRIQQVADAAMHHRRKLAFAGTSMVDNVKMARKLGYLNIPEEVIVPLENALNLPARDVLIMCTGSQGEPTSIIGRLSAGNNRLFDLLPDDTVVLSSHPIPGNEQEVGRAINRLLRRGVNVIYDRLAQVHVSGHASQEEQKMMLSLVRPKNFIPMHGELRMLKRHAWLAEQVGMAKENIFALENGYIIELQDGKVRVGERIPGGYVMIETSKIAENVPSSLRKREQPALPGTFVVNLSMDKRTNRLLGKPEVIARNIAESSRDESELVGAVENRVTELVRRGVRVERDIRDVVCTFVFKQTKRRPVVSVNITKA